MSNPKPKFLSLKVSIRIPVDGWVDNPKEPEELTEKDMFSPVDVIKIIRTNPFDEVADGINLYSDTSQHLSTVLLALCDPPWFSRATLGDKREAYNKLLGLIERAKTIEAIRVMLDAAVNDYSVDRAVTGRVSDIPQHRTQNQQRPADPT